MVRKAVIREPAQPATVPEMEDDAEFQGLTGFLAELGDTESANVTVYRDVKGRATGAYLFRCTPGEFSVADVMDKLRDEYEGGVFRVVVTANGQRLKNALIEVEPPKKSPFGFLEKQQQQPQQNTQNTNDLANVLLQMQESNRAQAETMREAMMQMQQENTRTLLEVFKAQTGSSDKTSTAEMLNLLTIARQLSAPNEIAQGPEKMLEMFFEGMRQGREMAANSGGEKNILQTALETFGPAIAELAGKAGQQQAQQRSAPQRQLQKPAMQQPTAAIAPPLEGEQPLPIVEKSVDFNEVDSTIAAAQPYIVMLMNAARQDADPEVYANLLLDQIPHAGLKEYLENDIHFSMLLTYMPSEASNELRPWFDSLREMTLELVNSELGDAGDTNADGQHQHTQDVPRGTGSALSPNSDTPE